MYILYRSSLDAECTRSTQLESATHTLTATNDTLQQELAEAQGSLSNLEESVIRATSTITALQQVGMALTTSYSFCRHILPSNEWGCMRLPVGNTCLKLRLNMQWCVLSIHIKLKVVKVVNSFFCYCPYIFLQELQASCAREAELQQTIREQTTTLATTPELQSALSVSYCVSCSPIQEHANIVNSLWVFKTTGSMIVYVKGKDATSKMWCIYTCNTSWLSLVMLAQTLTTSLTKLRDIV